MDKHNKLLALLAKTLGCSESDISVETGLGYQFSFMSRADLYVSGKKAFTHDYNGSHCNQLDAIIGTFKGYLKSLEK